MSLRPSLMKESLNTATTGNLKQSSSAAAAERSWVVRCRNFASEA